jgi:type IV pilus assembly protein PilO
MKNQPWYIWVILGILAVGLVVIVYFKPNQAELKGLQAQCAQVEAEVMNLKAKKRQLDKIEAELVELNKGLAELETIIPQKKEIGEMLRAVQQMASDARLTISRFAPDREIAKDIYAEQPIPIEVIGSYHNLGAFFDRLLHYARLINVEDFSVKALPIQSEEGTISALFTAKTYFFFEPAPIKKAPANKPAKPVQEKVEYEHP